MYSTLMPERAVLAATSSRSVDLPTPGSPASSTTAPGTNPPPSTRSNSPTPVGMYVAASAGTCPMGTAGMATAVAVVPAPVCAVSTTLPQAWHSPHLPTHLVVVQPHSSHTHCARALLMPSE